MQFLNSRTGKKEHFSPLDANHIKLYVCGPTVYNCIHIGNARPLVIFDCLFRLLNHRYKKITYVRNITDLDDKIYQCAHEKNINIATLTTQTTRNFLDNCQSLNCLEPTHQPKATEHISHMIAMISTLLENGFAYQAEGHVLFSHAKITEKHQLIPLDADKLREGARVEVAPYKKDSRDFVLWKPSGGDTNITVGWDSPFGFGRPGWHIECSAMAMEYLGADFDIHGGGQDLLFPHHYNEYAQSCAACPESQHAQYWLHNGYVLANGEKMSKSLGNFFTVNDLLKDYHGETIRLLLLMTHYRQPLDFSYDKMNEAQTILDKFYQALRMVETDVTAPNENNADKNDADENDADENLLAALSDDLNTPLALSHLHHMATQINQQNTDLRLVKRFLASAHLLGIMQQSPDEWFAGNHKAFTAEKIETMIAQRNQARHDKNYALADSIRDTLEQNDILLEDTETKTLWKKR